jgi:hypothetical protein
LQAGAAVSDFFALPVPKAVWDNTVISILKCIDDSLAFIGQCYLNPGFQLVV